ncbi:SpaH/EbpB family LPXTG-anchored major pilin [Cellulomonas hominis]|uniref:SpaH/EbpB family LPXTG-anchored major pilin n=1 Tax=Cellulomonas hominis TaxID=156981 RepID=UPI001B993D60|nr:SpaH/EbpB family LPXTG-anchored major pilin [Cellulomonas hominis]VTR76305.1 Fimbrial subunit type 1 [Cellulomonas hominis]
MKARHLPGGRAVLAAGTGIAMLALAAGPATAAPVIDPAQRGSITIHKYEQPDDPTQLPHDGTLLTPQQLGGLEPMDGVQFTVQQVDPAQYDLTTNAGWSALEGLTPAAARGDLGGHSTTVTTAGGGTATAGNLPLGVYLVTETVYPAGVTPSAPFLVTVPLTDPTNLDTWLYDVHVYPKNSVTTSTKTVDDSEGTTIGDTVEFTITGDIPDLAVIDGYQVVDQLAAALRYESATVTLAGGPALDAGDYTVTHDAGTVTVRFTPAGLLTLAANPDAQVQVVLTTTVLTAGEILNEAAVYPNLPSFTITPGEPGGPIVTPEVVTKWGNLTLQKVDGEDDTVLLPDAEFRVYLTEQAARAQTGALSIDGVSSWTTDGDGLLTISGLRYSGWADGVAVAPGQPGYQSYWVAEVKAPDGYELLAAPIEFTVDDVDTAIDLTVENVAGNGGFTLPLTGAAGTALFGFAGALLVVGATLLALRSRRQRVTVGA